MKISGTTIFVGPSIYSRRPVVYFTLDNAGHRALRSSDRSLLGDLFSRLPGLRTHSGLCSAETSFRNVGDAEVIPTGHLFEHVCIVLQNLAGADLPCIREEAGDRIGPDCAAIAYEESEVCIEAARLASDLIASLSPANAQLPDAAYPVFDFSSRLDGFIKFAAEAMLPVQDRALIRTARALDIPVRRLVGRTIALGEGRFQRRLSATKTSFTDIVSNDLAANKDYSRRIFKDLGLPVPRYKRVYSSREAVAAAKRIGYPVVVKPNNGSMGTAVSVGMKDRREVMAAYKRAREAARSVLVEEMVEGADFRMLVVNGKFCAASKRVPGHVVGDGVHTVEELVNEVNSDPRRGSGPTSSWTRIELDEQADRLITELGYTRSSIPPDGEVVFLRRNANTSDGGTAVDITDEVHPDNRDIAVRAARAIGLDIAGVDLLTTDISSSMWKNGGRICEINSRPGLRKHLWPATGKPRDVLTPIIDMLFPGNAPSRVPTVAITGTGNTGIAARMLAHVLAEAGHHVGLATGGRVYSGGRRTRKIRPAPPAVARAVFLDPAVDVAVLEIAPLDILQHGLGCDSFDVVAVINAEIAPAAEDEVAALQVVARVAREAVYVGAADSAVAALESSSAAARLCRVMGDKGARSAPGAGKYAVAEGDSITLYEGGRVLARIPSPDLVKRSTGAEAAQNAQGALYASLCAFSLGKDPKEIFRSLNSFNPEPGRRKASKRRPKVAAAERPDGKPQPKTRQKKAVRRSASRVPAESGNSPTNPGRRGRTGRHSAGPAGKR